MGTFNPLDHPICFSLPLTVPPAANWVPHAPFAMVLVDLIRPRVIVELGDPESTSYSIFCQAVRELRLETHCFAVTLGTGQDLNGTSLDSDHYSRADLHEQLYRSFSTKIRLTGDEAVALFKDQTIDLLHLAAVTSYPEAKVALETWLPKLSCGGVVLLSETNFRTNGHDSWKLWAELKSRYPYFEFLHDRGLGLVSIGTSPRDPIKQLVEACEP